MHKSIFTLVCAASLLAACGNSSGPFERVTDPDTSTDPDPTPVPISESAVRNADGTVTVALESGEINLPNNGPVFTPEQQFIGQSTLAEGYETNDVFAVAGFANDTLFSAVDGTTVAPPAGSATYAGTYSVVQDQGRSSETGSVILNFDLPTMTISGNDTRLSLSSTVTNTGDARGTVSFDGDSMSFEGGFFGADPDFAGAFNNSDVAGIIHATDPSLN